MSLGEDLPFGYYVAKLECVVLEQEDNPGWVHHDLDCTTLDWYSQAP